MMLQKKLFIFLILVSFKSILSTPQDLNSLEKTLIPNTILLHITSKGELFIKENFKDFLENSGFNTQEGYFPDFEFSFDIPSIEKKASGTELGNSDYESRIRSIFNRFFVGLQLQKLKPLVKTGKSSFILNFNKLLVKFDHELYKGLNFSDGAVLGLELEVSELEVASKEISVIDLNNPFIGRFGFIEPSLKISSNSNPLYIYIPVHISMEDKEKITINVLDVSSNIADIDLNFSHSDMVLPKISFEINENRFELNQETVKEEFDLAMPSLLKKIQSELAALLKDHLSEFLDKQIVGLLEGKIGSIDYLVPPGAPEGKSVSNYIWGLSPGDLKQDLDSFDIYLNGFIEDPENNIRELNLDTIATELPDYNGLSPSDYELALALNKGFINRILNLSFERGYFEKISLDENEILRLVRPPVIDTINSASDDFEDPKRTKIKLKISLEKKITGFSSILFKNDHIKINFDILSELSYNESKTLDLKLFDIDFKSLIIDSKELSWLGEKLENKIRKSVYESLKEVALEWKENPKIMAESLPLPPRILGVDFDVVNLKMDSNGYLLMYLNARR